ncbi:protein SPT2 homolog [Hippopotamus amphibius kiboko]|uniref:protein SPT2 homolog n=1 Tax=Hippopotamus amphibius kiboko TaxID=575201 RepID=UPI002597DA82|nr:protein SPT2 homolog [Hippopotamus amphibius kiboko]
MSPGSATRVTSAGSLSCDFSRPGSPERPPSLPTALLALDSCAWQAAPVCAPRSRLETPALPSPPFTALFAAVSPLPLGAPERQLEEEQGRRERTRRSRGGVGGERQGGCGLAAALQLVAGDPIPPSRPSDGEEEIRLDTHTRTQLGTSPGGSRRGPGGGRDSTSSGEPGAHTAWQIGRKLTAQGPVAEDRRLSTRRSESGAAPVPAWGEEDAHLLPQSCCGPRHCADSGSRGRPCRARAAGARPAVPGSSLPGKCRKRALNSTTSRPPPPLPGSPPRTWPPPPPPARRARPPLTLTRASTARLARSHSSRRALRRAEARASETTGPTAAGTAGDALWAGATRRGPPRPGLPPAPPPPPGTLVSRARCPPRTGEGL